VTVYRSTDPAYSLYEDDGTTPNAVTAILMGHTGTLMTDGLGNGENARTGEIYGKTVDLGPDTSAAAINPALLPDISPLPDGYQDGPDVFTDPIY
jgi:hypothetical protein